MAIVKCENTKCKYYDDGFYCTKFIVEMTDGMCDYWLKQEVDEILKKVVPIQQEKIKNSVICKIDIIDENGNFI